MIPAPRYHGWTIVAAGLVCALLSSPGQSFVISLYLEHLIADTGLTRVQLSSLYAGATLFAAAVLPFVGRLADRITARRFMTGVLVALGGFLSILGIASGLLTVAVAFFGLRLLGQGAIGLGTLTAAVRWFERYRGRALSMIALGYAAGELVFPAVVLRLTNALGWRGSLLLMAAAYVALLAPVVGVLMRERDPASEPMDGTLDVADRRSNVAAGSDGADGFTLAEAVRTPVFGLLLLCTALPPLFLTAIIFHQVALFDARAWPTGAIPAAFAAFAITRASLTFLAGFVLERVPVRFAIAIGLALAPATVAWYAWAPEGTAGILGYGMLLGASSGLSTVTNSLVWPDYFGVRVLGTLKGVVSAFRNGATALGPSVVAAVHVWTGGFGAALTLLAATAGVSAVTSCFLRPPQSRSALAANEALAA